MDYLVHHLLQSSAERFPDKESLVCKDQRVTYSELLNTTWKMARFLQAIGVERNDRVGIFMPLSIEIAQSIFAVSASGGVFVPIHHSLLSKQVSHIVSDCEIKILIVSSGLSEKLDADELKHGTLEHVIVADEVEEGTGEDLPWTVHTASSWQNRDIQDGDIQDRNFQLNQSIRVEQDLAAILYTSGSTGLPKGVMLSHKNIMAGASIVSDYLGIVESDRILAALPFSFDAGLNQLTTAIQQGATIVLLNFLMAREIVVALNQEKVTGLAGVPPLWNLLVQPSSTLAKNRPRQLRYITNTGGAISTTVLEKLRGVLPDTQVFLMYGLTEAFRSTYLPPEEIDKRPTSIGKAIPNTEILVVREDGTPCEPFEHGELVHHGPTVSLGYWGQPEKTQSVIRPHPYPLNGVGEVDRVVYSGDLVFADEDGYLFFVGRRDNMIKTCGFRVSPNEVESGLLQTGLIQQAAAIGVPDEMLGQRIHAFVISNNSNELCIEELLSASSEILPRHMLPKEVTILENLPLTSSGKVDYKALHAAHET